MPYKGVGRVGNATKNAALSLRKEGDKALLKVYATGVYENASIKVTLKDTVLYETETSLSRKTAMRFPFLFREKQPQTSSQSLRQRIPALTVSRKA